MVSIYHIETSTIFNVGTRYSAKFPELVEMCFQPDTVNIFKAIKDF